MKPVRIASRASKLALIQANLVRKLLEDLCPDIESSIVEVSTKGDRDKSDFLYKSESRGLFTSEVENALIDGRADLAVHSLKDLPTLQRPGLIVAAIPQRESPAGTDEKSFIQTNSAFLHNLAGEREIILFKDFP